MRFYLDVIRPQNFFRNQVTGSKSITSPKNITDSNSITGAVSDWKRRADQIAYRSNKVNKVKKKQDGGPRNLNLLFENVLRFYQN